MVKAYITLTTDSFIQGTLALYNSLKQTTNIPLYVMYNSLLEENKNKILSLGANLLSIEFINNPQTDNKNHRFYNTYLKLNCFGLIQFDKIVFLDSDTIVLKNIDDLFDKDHFSAAPDYGMQPTINTFNSGVMVISPSLLLFNDILEKKKSIKSPDESDQGFLNEYFNNKWNKLDYKYNTLKRLYLYCKPLFKLSEIRVLHFVGEKPWNQSYEESLRYFELNKIWNKYAYS